jgi:Spy/CpxP family protein refolding chaperone
MNFKISAGTLVIASALTLGAAATAFAVAPSDSEHCSPGRGMGGMQGGIQQGMKDMSRLHSDLKLDAPQEALWQEAEKATKDNMGGMREQMQKQREAALATLNQPGADLRAVMKQMDEAKDIARKQHEAGRDRWLAVYDSLNAGQKEKARLFFKSKLEHMGQMPGDGKK